MAAHDTTEVLICGSGPAGLLTALGLEQQGINTMVIDKRLPQEQSQYGRATTLYPRSLELLEQLDVTEDLLQQGVVCRGDATFRDGVRKAGSGWHALFTDGTQGSKHDYILNIRQKYSEEVFRAKYRRITGGKEVRHGWALTGFREEALDGDECNVTATLVDQKGGSTKTVRCKYLVGADGGSSLVRELSGARMEGSDTTLRWIRIDGKMRTDMPSSNLGAAAIETKDYGNVLWVKLDRDAHRIGISLPPPLLEEIKRDPTAASRVTQEQAVAMAVEAMRPFRLEIERVDWWTLYSIRQKVASSFQPSRHVLLAGDAAHTHSSGFAQGMNTAIHDATNLSWKLAGTLRGHYSSSEVLATYASERRSAAERLIAIDEQGAAAISGAVLSPDADADADAALERVWGENLAFSVGLGVTYGASVLCRPALATMVSLGSRAPDALIRHPGPREPRRLHQVLRGGPSSTSHSPFPCWSVLVFAGWHHVTGARVAALRDAIATTTEGLGGLPAELANLATLIVGPVVSAWDAFPGGGPVGRLYHDVGGDAHDRYCVAPDEGAIVVVRPDGIIGYAAGLDGLDRVRDYFAQICR